MMSSRFFMLLLFLALSVAAAIILSRKPEEMLTGAAHAIDGDSVRLNGQELRLKGLDAPEARQTCADHAGKDYPCGRQSTAALARLLARGPATCIGTTRDRYGRLLVTCRVNGVDIGAELVKNGHAVAYGGYDAEERFASEDRRGIWTGRFEMPETYRHRMRDAP